MMDLPNNQLQNGRNSISPSADPADTIKILISTDNHVGYNEKCKVRGNDSLATFEEVLSLAQENDVDMILLGGDLFHENKPSRVMRYAVSNLLRKYTMGDKPCQIKFLSDPSVNFNHSQFPIVNYEDPNVNISYPVFSIHGNHDDPSSSNLCELDMLSSAGLVNYFGKCDSIEKVEVSPVLLKKGQTLLALYGLGCIRDERLHRLFEQKKVSILKPKESLESWFNLFVIHQNRAKHSEKDYIPESFLGDFLDFVLWGHEHECRIDPEFNGKFWVSQPGSSVVTSLSEGEAKPKHCGLLEINRKSFTLRKLRLNTVRPFFFEDVNLSCTDIKPTDITHEKKVLKYCKDRVEALIERAKQEQAQKHQSRHSQLMLPLIRLRVDHTGGYETFNTVQFGQQYVDKVANPKDIVLFTKKRDARVKGEILHLEDIDEHVSELSHDTIEELVNVYLSTAASKGALKLDVLCERSLGKAIGDFVIKDDNDSIHRNVAYQVKSFCSGLSEITIERDTDIPDAVKKLRSERSNKTSDAIDEEWSRLQESQQSRPYIPPPMHSDEEHSNGEDSPAIEVKKSEGRGGRGSRGRRGSSGARGNSGGRGRAASKSASIRDYTVKTEEDDDDIVLATPVERTPISKPPAKKYKGVLPDSDDDDDSYLPGKRKGR